MGCSISQASLSIMSEMVDGQDLDLVRRVRRDGRNDALAWQGVDEEVLDELRTLPHSRELNVCQPGEVLTSWLVRAARCFGTSRNRFDSKWRGRI